jgi:hypothetical protein
MTLTKAPQMFWHKHLVTAICLLGGCLFGAAGAAGDQPKGHIIGLYHRGGLGGIVLEEVLETEGIPYARLSELSQLASSNLRGLVLDECSDDAVHEIKRFLERGGALLTLRPSGALAEALGLKQVGVQKGGYLVVDSQEAKRISYEGRLQLFGQSIHYRGGETLVGLKPATQFGGIIRVKRGAGTAMVASFDLATTLLTILQPVSECGKVTDASKVEYELGDVPQVDLLRRLLVGAFLDAVDAPILRKWYFPSQRKAMLAPVGDQDGADFAQLKVVLGLMKEAGTPYTLYVTPTNQPVTKAQFRELAAAGMELALHPDFISPGRKFTEQEFVAQAKKAAADIGCPVIGERTHGCRWESFRQTPSWAEKAGLQYDAILGIRSWESKPAKHGYWVGTGLPYHFVDPEGPRRLDFLEIPTSGDDNLYFWKTRKNYVVAYKPEAKKTFVVGLGLTEEQGLELSKKVLDRAVDKYYSVCGYNWHPFYLALKKLHLSTQYSPEDTHFRKCVAYAKSRGMGVTGTNALNDFWRARGRVACDDFAWQAESATLRCRVHSDVKVRRLTLILPLRFHGKKANVCVNNEPINYSPTELFGAAYAMFDLDVDAAGSVVTTRYGP